MEKTIFEAVKEMDFDQFVEWILINFGDTCEGSESWFDKHYCQNCERIDNGNNGDWCYCEINKCCKYFPDEKEWWSSRLSLREWLNQNFKDVEE